MVDPSGRLTTVDSLVLLISFACSNLTAAVSGAAASASDESGFGGEATNGKNGIKDNDAEAS